MLAQSNPIELSGSLATVIISGTILIIGALTTAIVATIKALGDNRAKSQTLIERADTVVAQNEAQMNKLDRVEILVDGRYGEILQELADVRKLLASISGLESDRDKADAAQTKADEQHKRVVNSNITKKTE